MMNLSLVAFVVSSAAATAPATDATSTPSAADVGPSTQNLPAPKTPPVVTVTARRPVAYQVLVLEKRTVLFAAPDHSSAALRMCAAGEILTITAEVDAGGETWLETPITDNQPTYVRKVKVSAPGDVQRTDWLPKDSPRDHLPFGIGATAWDKTFGYGMHARYQLMSRFGVAFTLGAVLDKQGRVHGGAWSLGLSSFLVLWNLSPVIEAGIHSLYYDAPHSMLRVWSFYTTLGLEWLWDFGLFVNLHGTAMIGFTRSVTYSAAAHEQGPLGTDNYGPFSQPAGEAFFFLRPGVTIGWAL